MEKNNLHIKDIIKTFPLEPGVYIMKNKEDEIIYIGKAKKLKKRVSSYFNNNVDKNSKVGKLVSKIDHIDYIVTHNELEALILECNLIKKHKPIYNILLKDDKGYKFIKISPPPYSRISVVNKKKEDKSLYIGPYMSGFTAKEIVNTVSKIFKLPTCNRAFFQKKKYSRPCLDYYINLCSAPCCNYISIDEYQDSVNKAVKYIKSGMKPLIKELKDKMNVEAKSLNFEEAAKIRDQIKMIEKVDCKENVMISDYVNADVLVAISYEEYICGTLLIFRDYKLIDKKQCIVSSEEDLSEVRKMMLLEYYTEEDYKLPEVLYLDQEPKDFELLKEYILKDIKLIFEKDKKTNKLMEMARSNSRERILQEKKLVDQDVINAEKLKKMINLDIEPRLIEAYDISNFGNQVNVGAMVVFENGKPKKSSYRKFKIKDVVGQDDYKSMAEVIDRRLKRYETSKDEKSEGFSVLPDLIFIDGGYNHISVVKEVLRHHNINLPVYGMVKNNKHETDKLVNLDNEKIEIKEDKQVYLFIKRIQDEIHRFVISYSRKLHDKESIKTVLSKIKGVGSVRKNKLISHFKSVENIKKASIDDISKVSGIPYSVAKDIYEYFNDPKN